MANSDKDIRIVPNRNKSGLPNIAFTGYNNDPIILNVLDDNTISFEGSSGQLFSVSNAVTTGTIFSVNDISGIPSFRIDADGTVGIAEFSGNVGIGLQSPQSKLSVGGDINVGAGYTFRVAGTKVLDSSSLGTGVTQSSLTSLGTITSGTWQGTAIGVNYGGTGATNASDARSFLGAATAGTNSDLTRLLGVQHLFVTIPTAAAIGITVKAATSQSASMMEFVNSSNSLLAWITKDGTFVSGGYVAHNDGRIPGVSVNNTSAAGIVVRGSNSDNNAAFEVQNNPGSLTVGLYPSGLVYGGVLQAYSSTASTSTTTGALIVAGGAAIGGSVFTSTSNASSISGAIFSNGSATLSGTFTQNNSSTTAFQVRDGSNNPAFVIDTIGDVISLPVAVASTSTGTGSLVVAGGVGIGGSLFVGNNSSFGGTLSISGNASVGGTLNISGNASIGGTLNVSGSNSYFQNNLYVGNNTQGRLYFSQATLGSAGTTVIPSMAFIGATNSPITLSVLPDNSLSFDGSSGQLFSINNNLSTGWIFSINDISGLPIFRTNADLTVAMGEYGGNVGIGLSNPTFKLQVSGNAGISGTTLISNATTSTNTTSGALVVSGGVGIGGSLFLSSSVPSSLSGVVVNNGVVSSGSWAGNAITVNYGGTGYNSYAKGDILVGAGSTFIKLNVGTDNFVLTALSTAATGLTWSPTAATGITTLNGINTGLQYLAIGYSGSVPAFSSSGSTHTLNIPIAGTGSTGLVSTQSQSFAGIKTFTNAVSITDNTGSGTYTAGALTVTGGVGIGGTLNVQGDFNVQGTFTTINSTTITVADKNIELGVVTSPSDLTAEGGGITLKGATDKLFNWYSGVGWSSSESINLASGNTFKINNTIVLSNSSLGTGVTNSSLAALGTITTGIWSATTISPTYGGTGLAPTFTVGDLLYANTSSTWGRLSASSNSGYILSSAGSGATPTYVNPLSITVGLASTSNYSYQSGYGITAGLATTATYSHQSGYAITSGSANTALYSDQSGYGLTSGLATTATYAHQSGYAITSGSSGLATTATNVNVVSASTSASHPVLFTPATGTASGAALSTESAFVYNPSTDILSVSGLAITSGTASTSSTTGALTVSGGVGIGQTLNVGGYIGLWNGSNFTGLKSNASSNVIYTLPASAPGTGSSVLQSDTSGILTWVPMTTSGTSTTSGFATTASYAYQSGYGLTSGLATTATYSYTSGYGITSGSANSWTTPRTLNLAGDLSGSVTWSGSGDTTITATIAANSVALGTDTTGQYASTLAISGSGITATSSNADDSTAYTIYSSATASNTASAIVLRDGSGNFSAGTITGSLTGTASTATYALQSGYGITAGSSATATTASNINVNNATAASAHFLHFSPSATGSGLATSSNTTLSYNPSTLILSTSGLAVTASTSSTTTSSGALIVTGGAGIGGSLFTSTSNASSISGVILNNGAITNTGTITSTGVMTLSNSSTTAFQVRDGSNNSTLTIDTIGDIVTLPVAVASTTTGTGSLVVAGGVGIGGSASVGGRLQMFNGANYTAFVSSASGNTVYTLPATSPATGTSVLQSTSAGVMTWVPMTAGGGSGTVTTLTAGTGISFSTGSTITTTGTIRARRPMVASFCAGYTPAASGADSVVIRLPDSPSDGTTAITYEPQEFHIRVETPSATTTTIQLEKYTGTGAFSGTAITSVSISGGAVYEAQTSIFAAAGTFLTSGDKLRINFTALSASHANFSVYLELEEV